MGGAPKDEKMGLKKGPWSPEEDQLLIDFIHRNGHNNWLALPKQAGLLRCGKSCRLRWNNYLRPDIKRGNFSSEEKRAIIKLHQIFGNKWAAIASRLPGRTDNEIKNVWRTHLQKHILQMAIDPVRNAVAKRFTSHDNAKYSHVYIEPIPPVKKDAFADNLVLSQANASVDYATTLSCSFNNSQNLSSEILSSMSRIDSEDAGCISGSTLGWIHSNSKNSFDVALGCNQLPPTIKYGSRLEDLQLDERFILEKQKLKREERWLPRQSQNATAMMTSEAELEQSSSLKIRNLVSSYPEDDCLNSRVRKGHQLWNSDMTAIDDDSDGLNYWLNFLRQSGPSSTL